MSEPLMTAFEMIQFPTAAR